MGNYLCPTVPRGPRDNFHHEKIGTQVRTLHADQVRTILCVPEGYNVSLDPWSNGTHFYSY